MIAGYKLPFVVFFMLHWHLDAGVPEKITPTPGIKLCQKIQRTVIDTKPDAKKLSQPPTQEGYVCTEQNPGGDSGIPDAE